MTLEGFDSPSDPESFNINSTVLIDGVPTTTTFHGSSGPWWWDVGEVMVQPEWLGRLFSLEVELTAWQNGTRIAGP
jgi:hypothetical protein